MYEWNPVKTSIHSITLLLEHLTNPPFPCSLTVVGFVSSRFSTAALSRNFRADANSGCIILTTCSLYVWVKSSENVHPQYHSTARLPGGGGRYICIEAADNTFRNRNINVSTQLGKKTRNLLTSFFNSGSSRV
jgi:hypothetical protein